MRFSGRGGSGDRGRRGSALSFTIIVSVVITGLVMTMSWSAGMQSSMASGVAQMDRAFYAAESGAQRVAWYCKNGKMGTIASPLTGTIGGYAYSANWVTVSGTTIRVTSLASLGNVAYTCYETITPPGIAAATLSNGGGGNMSGTVTITGNQETKNDVNANSNLTITGNLSSGGNINGSPHIGGAKTAHATGLTTPNVTTIFNTVSASATRTITNPSSISTLDFTTASNGVIYINGDANMSSNITVIGSGTVVVSGNWNQSGNFPATGVAQVNIVVKGDLNVSGSLKTTGSVYGGHNWNQSGTFAITGVVLITTDCNVSGSGTINNAVAPSFDPRTGGGSGSTSFTNFAGPMP